MWGKYEEQTEVLQEAQRYKAKHLNQSLFHS